MLVCICESKVCSGMRKLAPAHPTHNTSAVAIRYIALQEQHLWPRVHAGSSPAASAGGAGGDMAIPQLTRCTPPPRFTLRTVLLHGSCGKATEWPVCALVCSWRHSCCRPMQACGQDSMFAARVSLYVGAHRVNNWPVMPRLRGYAGQAGGVFMAFDMRRVPTGCSLTCHLLQVYRPTACDGT